MSTRGEIISYLQALLGKIIEGYQVTLPDGTYTCQSSPTVVALGQQTPFRVNQLPAINAFYEEQEKIDGAFQQTKWRLTANITGHFLDNASAEKINGLMEDITAVIESDKRLGGLARYAGVNMATPERGQIGEGLLYSCRMSVEIEYYSNLGRL